MAQSEILGEFTDVGGLVAALRAARERLGISFATLDELGQFAAGHAAKILAPNPSRRLGALSLNKLLFGLGLKLQLVVDPQTAPLVERAEKRIASQVRHKVQPLQPAA